MPTNKKNTEKISKIDLHACFIPDIKAPAIVGSSTSFTVHSSTMIAVPHIGSSHNGPAPTAMSKPAIID